MRYRGKENEERGIKEKRNDTFMGKREEGRRKIKTRGVKENGGGENEKERGVKKERMGK